MPSLRRAQRILPYQCAVKAVLRIGIAKDLRQGKDLIIRTGTCAAGGKLGDKRHGAVVGQLPDCRAIGIRH